MEQRLLAFDWAATSLGNRASWPPSLRTLVRVMLVSRQPMFIAWGPQRIFLYNDSYAPILGDKHPAALGCAMQDIWSEIWSDIEPFVNSVFAGQPVHMDDLSLTMHRHGYPEETHFAFSYTPIPDDSGRIEGLFCACTETTQQVLSSRAEKQTSARLEVTLKSARLGTYEWHPATGAVEADARAREIFGLPDMGALLDTDFFSLVVAEQFEHVQEECKSVIAKAQCLEVDDPGLTLEVAYDIRRQDGEWRSIISSGLMLRHGDGTLRLVGAFNDVTDLKRAEASLRDHNLTLEQQVAQRTQERDRLWRNTQDVQVVIDGNGVFMAVNPAFTNILGWEAEEVTGKTLFDFILPDDENTLNALERTRSEKLSSLENCYRHKDGGVRWFSWVAAPEAELIYASGRHITAEKDQAKALANAEAALRQAQKMEAVGQLTGGLAHDFNNLLAGISGSLELMQARMQQGRLADVDRYVTAAQGAAKRAAALTHRLLAFSRRQTLSPKPTNVNRLVQGMEDLIQRTVGPMVPVEVVGASSAWPALVDPSQLENALLNLCINARDAMPEGGKITVETANKWFDLKASQQHNMPEGQYLSLCVTDTGTGMTPEVIARAFEPFFTTKPIGEGTGLGLSMIYGFAQQSGGQVRIYSEVGQGSTVCIYLPRHYGEVESDETAQKAEASDRMEQGKTVLVVDDEPTVRMIMIDILEGLGFATLEAGDSAAGLKILQSGARIDLLVTDVGLPGGMNGRQMADAGRALRPGLKVIFITGYAENAVLGNGVLEPGMAIVTKPFSVDAMEARIGTMLDEGTST